MDDSAWKKNSNPVRETWKSFERATPKVKFKATDVRVLYVGRNSYTLFG